MFDPDAHMPRINRGMVYLGACLIAGIRLARERQVNVRVVPHGKAIEESVELISRTRVPASIAPELVADIFIRSCFEPFGACKASSIEVTLNLN